MNNKKKIFNKKIIISTIAIIIIVILAVFVIYKINLAKKEKYFRCVSKQQDLQFAKLDSHYNFYYKSKNVYEASQVYIFEFSDLEYYNQFDKTNLFPNTEINDEVLDEEHLIKMYYINNAIPYTKELSSVKDYIKIVEEKGYTCEKGIVIKK